MVFGGSRGIGAQICQTLSLEYFVIVLAKTTELDPKLPGNIDQVAKECHGFAIKCDVTNDSNIEDAINLVVNKFGRIDAVVYNAGSIFWDSILKTPMKRYDLMHRVNARGFYKVVQVLLPIFNQQQFGRIVSVSPPIYSRFFKGKTAYSMTKIAMSVLAIGMSTELFNNQAITCLWPATGIKSYVTQVKGIKDELLRKPEIFSDCCLEIFKSDSKLVNGRCLIDEDFLREVGRTDFRKYRCDLQREPPRMMPKKFPDLMVDEERAKL